MKAGCRDSDLEVRGVGVRVPVRSIIFLVHFIQTSSGAQGVSHPTGTGRGALPGGKAHHSTPSRVEVKNVGPVYPLYLYTVTEYEVKC
jgi:hypothetical protein